VTRHLRAAAGLAVSLAALAFVAAWIGLGALLDDEQVAA
jgi:hypothetical protein